MAPQPSPPTGRSWQSLFRRIFTGANVLALFLVVASVAGVTAGTIHLIRKDSQELVEQFEFERARQVAEAARLLQEDLNGIGTDLEAASSLVQEEPELRQLHLTTLLRFIDHYKIVRLYDERDAPLLSVSNLHSHQRSFPDLDVPMSTIAHRALANRGNVHATAPIAKVGPWHRVFALAAPPRSEGEQGIAVAILVDTEPLFRKLRPIADVTSHLLLFGFDGAMIPVTDATIATRVGLLEAERDRTPLFGNLVDQMRRGAGGMTSLPTEEGELLGFEKGRVVVSYAPIKLAKSKQGPWSIATLNSTSQLRARDSSAFWRLVYASGVICLSIMGFGVYVVLYVRRISAEYLRQEREHSASLSTLLDQRHEAEAALERAMDAAVAASRAKSEFLANMSHEIRTPMNGIIGMTALALGTELSREQRDYLAMVKASADSLLMVINDILDFSKIEAGKFELDDAPFGLDETISDTLKTLAFPAHHKGLDLLYHVSSLVPDALVGDALRIRQVLVNLVGNAIKFTATGEISVRVELEERAGDDARLRFTVEDTGIGIPAEKQRLIFEPFAQADGSTTRKYGGTGLGLAICSRLVEMMGGRIWVESRAGQGSTFHFTVKVRVDAEQPAPLEAPELVGLSILVVDHNATRRGVLEEVLTSWGAKPTLVADGDDAMDAISEALSRDAPFGLLLIDAVLSGTSGLELAEQIRRETPIKSPIVMMMTAVTRRPDTELCRALNIVEYVTRPIRPVHLLAALAIAVGRADETPPPSRIPEAPPERPRRTSLRILLAEDNPVNQTLAMRILEKEGHTIEVVGTGLAAIEALDASAFDLVLMDVQMPEMDGIDAIAVIRAAERQRPGSHMPAIAMTAFTMKGDRERFLESGFDGYVRKPIDVRELLDAIDALIARDAGGQRTRIPSTRAMRAVRASSPELLPSSQQPAAPPPPRAPEPTPAEESVPFKMSSALERVGGDEELLREIVEIFLGEYAGWIEEMRAAIAARDAAKLKRAAHTMKGAVDNCGAGSAFDAARALERMGHEGDLDAAPEALTKLERELARLAPALSRFVLKKAS